MCRLAKQSVVISLLLMAAVPAVSAENALSEVEQNMQLRQKVQQRIDEMTASAASRKRAMEEGRDRTVLCSHCHGEDGMAIQPVNLKKMVPNLAGQNPVYMVDQFQRFGDGRRNEYFMSNLAKTISEDDKIKISLYYASLPNRASGGGNPVLRAKGKQVFLSICSSCHGEDGKGQEGYARLAGQRAEYVVQMLKTFRDERDKRINPWMTGVAIQLDDQEIEAVASYLAHLE